MFRAECKKFQDPNCTIPESLKQLLSFVHSLICISRECLSPSSMFQRKKTGLTLLNLLTDLFVYIDDVSLRKKGSPSDSATDFIKFASSNQLSSISPLHIAGHFNYELVVCLEDQHDEIRELAYNILISHEEQTDDELLSDKCWYDKLNTVSINLMNSARFHETESGAIIIQFIAARLLTSKRRAILGNFNELCLFLHHKALEDFVESQDDYLLAAMEKPIFGLLLGISKCLKVLSIHKQQKDFIVNLIESCNKLSTMMICLLSDGKYEQSKSVSLISPSFAEIDKAMDMILSSSKCYKDLLTGNCCEDINLHCREILISFCWLNLKSVANILEMISNLCYIKPDIIDESTFDCICTIYEGLLINCRHKGVIEASYASLMEFARNISHNPKLWNIMVARCNTILKNITNTDQHASVTKRSAGVPMFVQSIISAEGDSNCLLDSSIKYLLNVAVTPLPNNLNVTVDLPQFNAINILRAIFRDNKLSNKVLIYCEEGVILAINGFASLSWSIRNASTLLLGTLFTRMLGQHVTQDKKSQQCASSIDVFFSWYPKLEDFFFECLHEQADNIRCNKPVILSHIIPVLTFLSKLKWSNSEMGQRLCNKFYLILMRFIDANVYMVRDLISSSIVSFYTIPPGFLNTIMKDIENNNLQNRRHTLLLIVEKFLKRRKLSENHLECILENVISIFQNNSILKFGFISSSIIVKIVSKLVEKIDIVSLEIIVEQFISVLKKSSIDIGKPMYETQLAKLFVKLSLIEFEPKFMKVMEKIVSTVADEVKFSDFHVVLIQESFDEIEHLHSKFLFLINDLALRCIKLSNEDTNLLSIAIKFLAVKFYPVSNPADIINKMFVYYKEYAVLCPVILNYLSKVITFYIEREEIRIFITPFCKLIKQSMNHLIEDHRLAAASTFSFMLVKLFDFCEGIGKDNIEEKNEIFACIEILLESSLTLLQDEDIDVRTMTAQRLHFIYDDSIEVMMQSNIIMNDYLEFIKRLALKNNLYLNWLHTYICRKIENNTDESNREILSLFEQESDNLYAEQDQHILQVSNIFQEICLTKTLDSQMRDRFFNDYKRIADKIHETMHSNSTDLKYKNIYGDFGNRQQHLKLMKMLVCLCHCKIIDKLKTSEFEMMNFIKNLQKIDVPFSIERLVSKILDGII